MEHIKVPVAVYVNTEIGDRHGHICTAENANIAGDIVTALSMVSMIETLREDEGDSITILCDNPDFNGQANNAVECSGFWTDHKVRRFEGATLLEAITNAYTACMSSGTGQRSQ